MKKYNVILKSGDENMDLDFLKRQDVSFLKALWDRHYKDLDLQMKERTTVQTDKASEKKPQRET